MSYSATVHINGVDYTYPGPGFPGLKVFFTPDDVEFRLDDESGAGVAPKIPAFDLGAHTADIFNNGAMVKTYAIPSLLWRGGWLHKITPDTILHTPAELIAANLILPFAPGALAPVPPVPRTFKGPGDNAGIDMTEPDTGEREDIGFITECAAYWMLTGNASYMLAEADGFQASPIWIIPAPGKPYDMVTNFKYQCYGTAQGGGSFIGSDYPAGAVAKGRWQLDAGHNPSPGYVAYLATRQTRYLKVLQYATTRFLLSDNSWSIKAGYCVVTQGQARSCAWVLRDLLQTYVATMLEEKNGNPFPSDLHPSSYWKALIDNQLRWFKHAYQADPAIQTFRFFPGVAYAAPWEQDFLNTVIGFAAQILPAEWGDFYLWTLGNLLPRCTAKYGWAPAMPSTYRLVLGPGFPANYGANSVLAGNVLTLNASMFYPDWKALLAAYLTLNTPSGDNLTAAQISAIKADPFTGGNYTTWSRMDALYVHTALSVAVDLDRRGIVNVSAALPELEAAYALQHSMTVKMNFMPSRQYLTVAPRGAVTPPVVVPPPVVIPPTPTGTPPMSNPVDLSGLAAAVHAVTGESAAMAAAVQHCVDKFNQLAAAAAAAGSQVDPAAILALTAELTADAAAIHAVGAQAAAL